MIDDLRKNFAALRSTADFWSLRFIEETQEHLAVRQDTVEPPRLSIDRGAMLVAMVEGGYGYCATSDLSTSGLQAALDRATSWADSTRDKSVYAYDPRSMPSPKGERLAGSDAIAGVSRAELHDLLADECRQAAIDPRIVERSAALELRRVEQLYLTNHGGDVHQQFTFAVPYAQVTANEGSETQTRSFTQAQQGGLEQVERSGFPGCGRRLAEEALEAVVGTELSDGPHGPPAHA